MKNSKYLGIFLLGFLVAFILIYLFGNPLT